MTVPLAGVRIVEAAPGRITLETPYGERHSFDYSQSHDLHVGDTAKMTTNHRGELIALERS